MIRGWTTHWSATDQSLEVFVLRSTEQKGSGLMAKLTGTIVFGNSIVQRRKMRNRNLAIAAYKFSTKMPRLEGS